MFHVKHFPYNETKLSVRSEDMRTESFLVMG